MAAIEEFFGSGPFVRLTQELRQSDAYIGLSKSAQLVLIDFIAKWNLADATDKKVQGGITFQFTECTVDVASSTFRKAMDELCLMGFVERNASRRCQGDPYLYVANRKQRWRKVTVRGLRASKKYVDFQEAIARIEASKVRQRLHLEQMRIELPEDGERQTRRAAG